jgi:hypothetical protein
MGTGGGGAIKRKSIKARLAQIREAAVRELTWVPTPAWFIGGQVDILLPVEDVDLTSITKAVYVAAVEEAVEAGELRKESLEPEWQERSWARFIAWSKGDHGPHVQQQQAPPRPSVEPAVETYPSDRGPRQPRETTAVEDRWDEERRRLIEIANRAPVRYFT